MRLKHVSLIIFLTLNYSCLTNNQSGTIIPSTPKKHKILEKSILKCLEKNLESYSEENFEKLFYSYRVLNDQDTHMLKYKDTDIMLRLKLH